MKTLVAGLALAMICAAPAVAQEQRTPEWAAEQHERGVEFFRAQDFVAAEAAYREALNVRTRTADPDAWAQSTVAAGEAQSFRGIRTRDAGALQGAITDYRAALSVYARESRPQEWARTQNNLATALVWLAQVRGDTSPDVLIEAEEAFQNVLLVTTVQAAPADAGVVLYNIGTVQERIGDRLSGEAQRGKYRAASETYAAALDALRRGGNFSYASDVERRVSPFMHRVAAMD